MKTLKIAAAVLLCAVFMPEISAQEQEPEYLDSVPQTVWEEDDKLLDEIVITAKKPIIQTSADKITYNMDEDPSAQTATVSDAMRKVPMVTVDAEGNIKLKGESNFKIYMNGKPDPSLSTNYKDILKSMPASSVRKIEVITEPGAKYDAEGVGGIINIITEGSTKLDGWTATLNATGGNRQVSGGVNATVKVDKVSLNLNYNHAYSMANASQESRITYLKDPKMHDFITAGGLDVRNNFDFGGLQLSWEPDSANLFTANGNLFNFCMPLNTQLSYDMYNTAGERQWGYKSQADFDVKSLNYTIGANWQHNFNSKGHNLVLLYQYNRNSQKDDRTYVYGDYENYYETIPSIRQESDYPVNEHTFQLDYTLPFAQKHTLEAGAKYIMRRNYGDTFQYNSADGTEWIYNEEASVSMKQYQDVGALYAAYTGKFGSWVFNGGLRYEHAWLSSKFKTPGHEDFSQRLNDLVPNAMVSYTFPDYSSLRLSYQMRITRPGLEQLNPYKEEVTPMNYQYGNPELISQKANNLNLTYSNFSLPVQLNLNFGYSYTDSMILEYYYLGADNASYRTYGNLGHSNQGYLYAYLAYPITPDMRLSVNAGCNYTDYKSGLVNVHNHGWGWNAGGDFYYQMPWDLELNAYGGAGNTGVSFQGTSSVYSYHGLAITKSLLAEKRLRITLSGYNMFNPKYSYSQTTHTPDLTIKNTSSVDAWGVSLTVSLRLGSFKGQVKSTVKSVTNDDVQQSQPSTPGAMPKGAGGGL